MSLSELDRGGDQTLAEKCCCSSKRGRRRVFWKV